MLRSLNEVLGYNITIDGFEDVGKVDDFLFDDDNWNVQFMIAKTGGWLNSEKRLITNEHFRQPQWDMRSFPVDMSEKEIETSPEVDESIDMPNRQRIVLPANYQWDFNWIGELHRPEPMPLRADSNASVRVTQTQVTYQTSPALLSVREALNFEVIDRNAKSIGRMDDFIVDDQEWMIRYMVLDTGNILTGKKVLVSPIWLNEIDFDQKKVYLDLAKETIEEAPEFDPGQPINRKYEEVLYDFYGRPTV